MILVNNYYRKYFLKNNGFNYSPFGVGDIEEFVYSYQATIDPIKFIFINNVSMYFSM